MRHRLGCAVQRVLDLDLDLFVDGVAHWRNSTDDRLDAEDFPPWSVDEAVAFLTDRCQLRGPLPGFVVEHHGDLFGKWRSAIDAGLLRPPFHVTHADAHADLGMGDPAIIYVMSELLYVPPEARRNPNGGTLGPAYALGNGNYLTFAIACRWVADLVYVFNSGGGEDVLVHVMEGFDPSAANVQLAAVPRRLLVENLALIEPLEPDFREPPVPFRKMLWSEYRAPAPFDIVCLARSPGFTPAGCDAIFDEIRHRFIDETAFSKS